MGSDGLDITALRRRKVLRISTSDQSGEPIEELVHVGCEAPVTIDVDGVDSYTVLCTPRDREALAIGFLVSEGIIGSMNHVASVKPCDERPEVIRVRLSGEVPRIGEKGRSLLIVSSCGACGNEDLQSRMEELPRVGDTFRVRGSVLGEVVRELRRQQLMFEACGCTHAAGIFSEDGALLASAEDVGRHNALDKAIGKCLIEGAPTAGRGAVLSGRVSLEMLSKCARAGIELICAVSAPTSLAIETAERCNVTLCAFVRETRATLFAHPRRVVPHPTR